MLEQNRAVFVLSDGMGGHNYGEVARCNSPFEAFL